MLDTKAVSHSLGFERANSSQTTELSSDPCLIKNYREINDEICNLWVGNDQGVCLGSVFSWIINDCKDLDKTDPKVQELFKKFQDDYELDRGSPDIDTTFLKSSTLEQRNLVEHEIVQISLENIDLQNTTELILEEASIVSTLYGAVMVVLHHHAMTHVFGLNLKSNHNLRLFDVALSRDFHSNNKDNMKFAIEVIISVYEKALKQKLNGDPQKFSQVQIIAYQSP